MGEPPPGGYSTGIWVGGFGRLNKTLTLFKTQRCKFFTLSKRKCCNFLPCSRLDQAGHIQNTKNGTRNQRKLCDRRGRKGGLGGPPCLRHENVKLYTLFKTENPENETLTVGTSLKRKYMGVPPPGGGALAPSLLSNSFLCGVFFFPRDIWFSSQTCPFQVDERGDWSGTQCSFSRCKRKKGGRDWTNGECRFVWSFIKRISSQIPAPFDSSCTACTSYHQACEALPCIRAVSPLFYSFSSLI